MSEPNNETKLREAHSLTFNLHESDLESALVDRAECRADTSSLVRAMQSRTMPRSMRRRSPQPATCVTALMVKMA